MKPFSRRQIPEEARQNLGRLAGKVEERLGLLHSEKRESDIWRAVSEMSWERAESPLSVLEMLAGAPPEAVFPERFIAALTVGETYFFRERKILQAFCSAALPEIRARKRNERYRFWSAGCSTGEEPYTLSMLLLSPSSAIEEERISILGTDINPLALEKAEKGFYSSWSFRGMGAEEVGRCFENIGQGLFSVRERFRRRVAFSLQNLAELPLKPWRDGGIPDAVFCRNVLIYFSAKKREEILGDFRKLLPDGGWLVVAPCETMSPLSSGFSPVHCDGATLFRKNGASPPAIFLEPGFFSGALPFLPAEDEAVFSPGSLPDDRADDEDKGVLSIFSDESILPGAGQNPLPPRSETETGLDRARDLADRGMHHEALDEVSKIRERDRTDPAPLYLQSLIQRELGNGKEAASSLRSVLFLDPGFVMAHYTLGALAMEMGRAKEADRHFRNAEEALKSLPAGDVLPESGGLSAAVLLETIGELRAGLSF